MTPPRTVSALATMVVLVSFSSSVPVAHADVAPAPVPTCHGQKATIVGSKLARITGTPGRDVIVTNGAERVAPLAGDDLVCGTNGGHPFVKDGPGDDVYDLRGGGSSSTILRAGDDKVRTGPGPDSVSVEGYGRDRIFLGQGSDRVNLSGRSWGERDVVDLGPGSNVATLTLGRGTGPRVDAEGGNSELILEGRSATRWTVNAVAGRMGVGSHAGVVKFSGFRSYDFQSMQVPALRFYGTDASEDLQLGRLSGAASYNVGELPPLPPRSLAIRTGGGADTLFLGSSNVGRVDGGKGVDELHVIADTFDSAAEADLAIGEISVVDDSGEAHLLRTAGIDNLTMTAFFPLFLGGDGQDNVLTARNCTHPQTIEGRGGDDLLTVQGSTYNITGCDTVYEDYSPGTLRGGDGDDVLIGDVNDDTIVGDEGYDTADGYGGNDTCSAEVVTRCGSAP